MNSIVLWCIIGEVHDVGQDVDVCGDWAASPVAVLNGCFLLLTKVDVTHTNQAGSLRLLPLPYWAQRELPGCHAV